MKRYRYFILLALPVLTLYSIISWSEVAQAYTVDFGPGFRARLINVNGSICLLYTSPSPRDLSTSRMPSSA